MSRRRKTPDEEDLALWAAVAETVTPLRPTAHRELAERLNTSSLVPASPQPAVKKAPVLKKQQAPTFQLARKPVAPAHAPNAFTGLDRRTTQKMVRGQVEPDARIDLHGLGVELARVRLREFVENARKRGFRTVLVITGKGHSPFARHTLHGTSHFHTPEREGRLRQLLPGWLGDVDFRQNVAGFQPAHPKHGGGGAFYVRLKRHGR